MNKDNYCVIMAGGGGTRFWPVSKEEKPKQFLDILNVGRTFIQQTFDRFSSIIPVENFLVVTSFNYVGLVKEQLPMLSDMQILSEPIRRNTAPCIAYATYKILKENPDAKIVVAPSDHIILNEHKFITVINKCLDYAETHDALVTVGLKPNRPETGYGYIQVEVKNCIETVCKVKTFTEKPNLETAKIFLESGEFHWNSGIFIWSGKSIEKALNKYLPEMSESFSKATDVYGTPNEKEHMDVVYTQCPNISIDYGIMEKADNVYVYTTEFGWSDMGTWGSLYSYSDKDDNYNVINSNNTNLKGVTNSLVFAENKNKKIVVKGLDNFLILDTNDALMICPNESESLIRQLVTESNEK